MKKINLLSNALFIVLLLVISMLPAGSAQASGTPALPILFGAYASGDLQSTVSEITAMNNWLTGNGASGVTFAGDFVGLTFNPATNVPNELNAAWNAGFVPFVNLMPSDSWEGAYYDPNCDTAADIANGLCDAKLTTWAGYFKNWAGSNKWAYLAPLPEVNGGSWVTYGSDGPTFIQAFIKIRTIFEAAGVPSSAVRWVFAPNGWNEYAYPSKQFENYYPGDNYVDVVSFSAYNFGGCNTDPLYGSWDTFEDGYKPYLDRMRAMAPSKPIFISQIGTVNVADADDTDPNQTKSAWVSDTFSKLADYPAVRGIIYFNKIKSGEFGSGPCAPTADYLVYNSGSNTGDSGFLNIMSDARFGKWALNNSKWATIAFASGSSNVFADMQSSHPFSGEANIWYYDYVISLYNAGVTGGCIASPLQYCPDAEVTRAQMAVFLEKGKNGSAYTPPNAVGNVFGDVSNSYWAAKWIEKLAADGITGGCGGGNYCPDNVVTRAQMAIFLLKAKHGSGYTPPAATGDFADVATSYWAAAWIEQLAVEGITGGCGNGNYCPDSAVSRAQMAVFLVKTFNLP